MNVLCLCPTYGRPQYILENTLACFERQDHPVESRRLLLLDDGGNVAEQEGESWRLMSSPTRLRSLPEKYNAMLGEADDWWPEWEAVVVWDDDDIYLPHHVCAHATALRDHQWSHPHSVYSTYELQPGESLSVESAAGRFHATLAIRTDLLERIGGWVNTRRGDFDQQQISTCQDLAGDPGRPDAELPLSYIFRWGDTGTSHCQSLITSPANEDWYERNARSELPEIGALSARFDEAAQRTLEELTGGGQRRTEFDRS